MGLNMEARYTYMQMMLRYSWKIFNDEDFDKLQEDLDELQKWTERWMLNFHHDKSKHIGISRQIKCRSM